MRALVTGCAGFIGSHLTEALLADGSSVVGLDALTTYYDPWLKRRNLERLMPQPDFAFYEGDINDTDLAQVLDEVDVVFHLAAQPGVRLSWAEGFEVYSNANILATQRLLEASRRAAVGRFVFASSSSVYGNAQSYPCREDDRLAPYSPYGVTKLAGERLIEAYASNFGLSALALRYFTVYGPCQRPDMAINRLMGAALTGSAFPLYGDGLQVRDFTFVGDVVRATAAAGTADVLPASVINVAGGSDISMVQLFELVEELSGKRLKIDRQPAQAGDVRRTGGSADQARSLLNWAPLTNLREGLALQLDWHRQLLAAASL